MTFISKDGTNYTYICDSNFKELDLRWSSVDGKNIALCRNGCPVNFLAIGEYVDSEKIPGSMGDLQQWIYLRLLQRKHACAVEDLVAWYAPEASVTAKSQGMMKLRTKTDLDEGKFPVLSEEGSDLKMRSLADVTTDDFIAVDFTLHLQDDSAELGYFYSGWAGVQFLLWPDLNATLEEPLELYGANDGVGVILEYLENIEGYTMEGDMKETCLGNSYPGHDCVKVIMLSHTERGKIHVVTSGGNGFVGIAAQWSTHLMNAVGTDFVICGYPSLTLNRKGVISTHRRRTKPQCAIPHLRGWRNYTRIGFLLKGEPCLCTRNTEHSPPLESAEAIRSFGDEESTLVALEPAENAVTASGQLQRARETSWNIGGFLYGGEELYFVDPAELGASLYPNKATSRRIAVFSLPGTGAQDSPFFAPTHEESAALWSRNAIYSHGLNRVADRSNVVCT
ncbi:hypothetical protein NM688_g548 [Phlebia brevispora]|uniref:Uncharacterized protein n=1 Tax=Phlebia brevispora TaxID=194682 RepID=A0ACC1TEE9_9APHY|nr:hypothetical protein NM688_g548 [Phlebia brevispora]